jgi:lipid-binding SYLF domain-containing protein
MIKYLRIIFAIPLLLFVLSCSTTPSGPTVATGGDPDLDAKARVALQRLTTETPKAKELQSQAKGVLVFPDIAKAGLIVGAEGGKGVMFGPDGRVTGYYKVQAMSIGLQAGAQAFSQVMFLMTDSAITALTSGSGLSVGTGPSVVVVDAGMAKSMTTTTMKSDVYAFIFGQEGLMAGIGLQGQQITKYVQ